VRAVEDANGTTGTWAVQAIAICARPPSGLERVVAVSPSEIPNKSVTATCPTGKRVLGTGGELAGADGRVVLDGIVPDGELRSVTANGVKDETGVAGEWSVTAYAICATAVTASG